MSSLIPLPNMNSATVRWGLTFGSSDVPDVSVGDGLLIQVFRKEGQTSKDQDAQVQLQDELLLFLCLVWRIPM